MPGTKVVSVVPLPGTAIHEADATIDASGHGLSSAEEQVSATSPADETKMATGTSEDASLDTPTTTDSLYDSAYIVTEVEVREFRRNAAVASIAWGLHMASFFVQGVSAPYSLNYILNDDADVASPASSGMLSIMVSVQLSCAISMQLMWGRGGSWWGRQRALVAIAALVLSAQVLGILAHTSHIAELWILSGALTGLSSAGFAQASSYCADMSTAGNFAKTTGLLATMAAFGGVAGLCIVAASGSRIIIGLCVASTCSFVALLTFAGGVPNISPPQEKRSKPTMRDIGLALLVCGIGRSFLEQTRYTQCLLGSVLFGNAGFGAFRIWLFGYGLVRFRMSATTLGVLLLVHLLTSGIVILVGTRCLPTTRTCNAVMWTQVLFSCVAIVGPGMPLTLWIGTLAAVGDGLGPSLLNTIYYGQLSSRRRGELSALKSLAEKLGTLIGVSAVGPVSVLWLQSHEQFGEGPWYTPPMVQLLFEAAGVALYYLAQVCLRHQDKFGLFVLRTADEVPEKGNGEAVKPTL